MKDYKSQHKGSDYSGPYDSELRKVLRDEENLLDAIHAIYPRQILLDKDHYAEQIGQVLLQIRLILTFAANAHLIDNYLVTIIPVMIQISQEVKFIEAYFEWVFIDDNGNKVFVFDTIAFVNPPNNVDMHRIEYAILHAH